VLRYDIVVQGSLVGITAQFTSLASNERSSSVEQLSSRV